MMTQTWKSDSDSQFVNWPCAHIVSESSGQCPSNMTMLLQYSQTTVAQKTVPMFGHFVMFWL